MTLTTTSKTNKPAIFVKRTAAFKPIPGFDRYFVNRKGQVISKMKNGKYRLRLNQNVLGYKQLKLVQPNGNMKFMYVHTLVALTFLPNPFNKPMVNHKDLDKANNNVKNLEWVTNKENVDHFFINRTEFKPKACLSHIEVAEIYFKAHHPHKKCVDIAKQYGCSRTTVHLIKSRRTHQHITKQVKVPLAWLTNYRGDIV